MVCRTWEISRCSLEDLRTELQKLVRSPCNESLQYCSCLRLLVFVYQACYVADSKCTAVGSAKGCAPPAMQQAAPANATTQPATHPPTQPSDLRREGARAWGAARTGAGGGQAGWAGSRGTAGQRHGASRARDAGARTSTMWRDDARGARQPAQAPPPPPSQQEQFLRRCPRQWHPRRQNPRYHGTPSRNLVHRGTPAILWAGPSLAE